MAFSEALAERVRSALARVRRVTEKKMFGGIAFIVNGKLCVTVGRNRIMARIDPKLHESVIRRKGVRTVTMGGRRYLGYVHVDEENLRTKSQLGFWLNLALDFNKRAKARRSAKAK